MADVFISYSKHDAMHAALLSAHLESEGFTVWYDRELEAADRYRDEIARELRTAKAVLAIWSPASIRSDWVRAEAGMANSLRTLISLRTTTVCYEDIPLPFGEVHIVPVSELLAITKAIRDKVGQHKALKFTWRRAYSAARAQGLGVVGITGTSLTVLSNLNGLVRFGEIASYLLDRWHLYVASAWKFLGNVIYLRIPEVITPVLTFTVFMGLLTFATRQRPAQRTIALATKIAALFVSQIVCIPLMWSIGSLTTLPPEWQSISPIIYVPVIVVAIFNKKLAIYSILNTMIVYVMTFILAYRPIVNFLILDVDEKYIYWTLIFTIIFIFLLSIVSITSDQRLLLRRLISISAVVATFVLASVLTNIDWSKLRL